MTDGISWIRLLRRAALCSAASVLGVVLLTGSAAAQPSAGRLGSPRMAHPGFLDRYADRLGLNEETRAKIRAVVETTHTSTESRETERVVLFAYMEQLLAADEPNETQVLVVSEKLGALERADRKDRLLALLAIRSLLTLEQREELLVIRKEPRRGHRRSSRLGPCSRDADRLCANAEPGRATLRCLEESWDKLSGHCHGMFQRAAPPALPPPAD
jgi:Spy/CpxP family protein refolding chaperone